MGESFRRAWPRGFWWRSPRESGPEPGRRRFFGRAGRVRMGAHRRRIHEHAARSGEGLGLEIFPKPLPDAARFPSPEAHVNRVPVAELVWQIAPWAAGALQMKHRFEELPIGHFTRRTGGRVFGGRENFTGRVPASPGW